ncbi:hypothetical protein FBU59_001952, partial [Linderina macrospora]
MPQWKNRKPAASATQGARRDMPYRGYGRGRVLGSTQLGASSFTTASQLMASKPSMSQPASAPGSNTAKGKVEEEGRHKRFTMDEYEVMFTNDLSIQDLLAPISPPSQPLSQQATQQPSQQPRQSGVKDKLVDGAVYISSSSDSDDAKSAVEVVKADVADTKSDVRPAERIQLDEHQEFVSKQNIDKPLLIMAGAGSGKTSTLCARVIEMIKSGVSPTQIMVITFTNKAAGELGDRIRKYMRISGLDDMTLPYSSTFHSWCYRLAMRHYGVLGLARCPSVISSEAELKVVVRLAYELIDDCRMLTQCETMLQVPPPSDDPDAANTMFVTRRSRRWDTIKAKATDRLGWQENPADVAAQSEPARKRRKKVDETNTRSEFAIHEDVYRLLFGRYGREHNLTDVTVSPMISQEDTRDNKSEAPSDKKLTEKLYFIQASKSRGYGSKEYDVQSRSLIEAYNEILRMNNLVDFDDMLIMAINILKDANMLRVVRERHPYLLVDEFQDLNNLQMDLVLRLQKEVGRITVVGDERQSIYGFRGASCENNFKTFLDNFVDADVARANGTPDDLIGSMQSLTVNYRSHKSIVDLGNVVARDTAANDGLLLRLRVPLKARETAPVVPVAVYRSENTEKEARSIAETIRSLIDAKACRPKDISVLFRFLKFGKYRPSAGIESALLHMGIPFVIRGGASL